MEAVMDLKGKVAIITGAGSGIGRATAFKLASMGAAIAIADISAVSGEKTAEEIQKRGSQAIAQKVDVTKKAEVDAFAGAVQEKFGRIDILVNNAGWTLTQSFLEESEDYWEKIIAINLKGVIFCSRAVLDAMITNKGGKIVSVSSDAGRVGTMGETVYAAAKGGVIAFTKSLAREVARYNITANCVCPGLTDTPLLALQSQKIIEAMKKAIPLQRVGKPEEVADAIAFFCSPASDYITGQVLSASGGITMAG